MPIIKPSLHILTVWRLRLLLCALLPSFLSAYFMTHRGIAWWICTLVWVIAFFYLYIFYYPIKLRKLSLGGNEQCLLVHCGVIYTRVKAIPYGSIQYVSITSTPLERFFGIRSLHFQMAGAYVNMSGLTARQTAKIRFALKHKTGGTFS